MNKMQWSYVAGVVVALALTGCGPSGGDEAELEIAGEYTDDFGTTHTFTSTRITQDHDDGTSVFHVTQFSNEEDHAIAQNDASNEFNPEAWSRFDWTRYDGSLWFCQTAFDAATEQDAVDTPPADDTDPSQGGCGDFPWSELTPVQ